MTLWILRDNLTLTFLLSHQRLLEVENLENQLNNKKNRGEKSSKLKLYSSLWSSWKLMTSMVIVDQISRKVEVFFEAAVEAVLRPRKQPMMTYIVFLWPKRTSLSSSTGFRVSRRIFFCLICQQNDAEKRGKSSTFTKKVFWSIWKLVSKIDFLPFLCFEV